MADTDSEDPKKPFNANAQRTEYEVIFEPENTDELKGNTDPRQEPKTVQNRQRTPSGATINFRPQKPEKQQAEAPKKGKPIDLSRKDINAEPQYNGYNILIKLENERSKKHLNGGVISRLTVVSGEIEDETMHAHFENGTWDEKLSTPLERQAVMQAIQDYDPESLKKLDRPDASEKTTKADKDRGR
jgi:hypothetical protein